MTAIIGAVAAVLISLGSIFAACGGPQPAPKPSGQGVVYEEPRGGTQIRYTDSVTHKPAIGNVGPQTFENCRNLWFLARQRALLVWFNSRETRAVFACKLL
jgi:hypothetical protein